MQTDNVDVIEASTSLVWFAVFSLVQGSGGAKKCTISRHIFTSTFRRRRASPTRSSKPPMLTRRVFRELTDSFLLGRPIRISCQCPRSSFARLVPTARHLVSPLSRSSSSSTRWKARQGTDHFAREAKVQGLKSRAAFKLLEVSTCQNIRLALDGY
jgi:hypothetical protein